jgi:hypothetical protein
VNFNCTKCGHEFSGPENLTGSKAKCTECGEVFVISGQQPNADNSEWFDPAEMMSAAMEAEEFQESPPPNSSYASKSKRELPKIEERYPSLRSYLKIMELLTMIMAVLIAVVSLFSMVAVVSDSDGSATAVVIAIIVGVFGVLLGCLFYVFSMAGLEFIQTVIDTEENTRRTNIMLLELKQED